MTVADFDFFFLLSFQLVIGKVDWDQKDIEGNYQIILEQMKVLAAERFVKKGMISFLSFRWIFFFFLS